MSILQIILVWLLLSAAFLLLGKYRDDKRKGTSFWDFRPFQFLVYSLSLFLLIWVILFIFKPQLQFENADEQIRYGEKTRQPWLITKALWPKITADPGNRDLHFTLLTNHFEQENPPLSPPNRREFNMEGVRIFKFYTSLSDDRSTRVQDLGNTFLAQWYLEKPQHDYENAAFHLRRVNDPEQKYVNYLAGKIILLGSGVTDEAEKHFNREIKNGGYREGSWRYLSVIYDLEKKDSLLKDMCYSPLTSPYVPEDIRKKVYYNNGDVISFYRLRLSSAFDTISLWGLAGAFLTLGVWGWFLFHLCRRSGMKPINLFMALGIGSILAIGSWWLYAFYRYDLDFWLNGELGNDLLFCFGGIGVIEELVKLIPFLLILRFTKVMKTPADYMLIASASGLGFAFFENLLYISTYGLDVIHSRALTSSLSHMACSGIVAYGFVLHKFRWHSRWWLIPLFFLFASAVHGLYDFWLLNETAKNFGVFTLLFFLTEIILYLGFLNNALNQTRGIQELSSAKTASVISGLLVLLFAFEYLAISIAYGYEIGNRSILSGFVSGGYLIYFISVRIAALQIREGEWTKLSLISALMPSANYNMEWNKESGNGFSFLISFTPSEGTTSIEAEVKTEKQLLIRGDENWYELTFISSVLPDQDMKKFYLHCPLLLSLRNKEISQTDGRLFSAESSSTDSSTQLIFRAHVICSAINPNQN